MKHTHIHDLILIFFFILFLNQIINGKKILFYFSPSIHCLFVIKKEQIFLCVCVSFRFLLCSHHLFKLFGASMNECVCVCKYWMIFFLICCSIRQENKKQNKNQCQWVLNLYIGKFDTIILSIFSHYKQISNKRKNEKKGLDDKDNDDDHHHHLCHKQTQ